MRKTFVLDTNVLLHDPQALTRFEDNQVVVPIEVVEEIDRFKRDPSEKGRNARQVSRLLDALREKGNLADGVPIDADGGGTLKVVFCRTETLSQLPPELKGGNGDNNILAVALEQRLQEVMGSQPPVVLVTKDTNLRIKADAVGLTAQDYTTDKVDLAGLYAGCCELWVSTTQMEQTRGEAGLPVAAWIWRTGIQEPASASNSCRTRGSPCWIRPSPSTPCWPVTTAPPPVSAPSRGPRGCDWGAFNPATGSRPLPWIFCSTPRCNCSRWWARPGRARPCWLLRRVCTRWPMSGSMSACW
jgi:hypothetical protein